MGNCDNAKVAKVFEDDLLSLYRITLPPPIPGYRDFLTPWLLRERAGRAFVVDVGPRSTLPFLVSSLKDIGVDRVDYALFTHVHIDHSGGLADFLTEYPEAKVIAHPRGLPHLVDPSRLWKGSLQTLGEDVARAYGEVLSVSEVSVLRTPLDVEGLSTIDTPGHASHHQSYLYFSGGKRILFAGEAAGVYYPTEYFLEMPSNHCAAKRGAVDFYLRPATPPRFFCDMTMESIQKIREARSDLVCSGHYGYSWDSDGLMCSAQKQLARWREVLSWVVSGGLGPEIGVSRLLEEDPLLDKFRLFPEDVRQRELYFLRNSVLGFMGYLSAD